MQINEQGGERERERTGKRGVTRVVVESAVQKSDRVRAKKKLDERKEEGKRKRGRTQRKGEAKREREREIKERTDARECNLF